MIRTATLLLSVLLAGGLTLAQDEGVEPGLPPGPAHGPGVERGLEPAGPEGAGRWWTRPEVIERLKLTEEQQARIDAISLKHGEHMIDLRAAQQKAQLALAHRIDAGAVEGAAVDKLIDDVAGADCALDRARLQARIEIARVLDKEQRLALREIVGERALRGRERPGRQGRPPR